MQLVSSIDELDQFCSDVSKTSKYVAIDTEFMRHNTYYAKVCLIQLAFQEGKNKRILLIDPLVKDINLKPLENLLINEKVTKVIHAGRQDLEIFLNLFNVLPIPLFDTQIAAMVCGKGEQESYENLVKNLLGKQVNKAYQFTDWTKRPLSDEQIKYASEDVSYLCDLFESLEIELDELGRSTWIIEEIEKLTDKTNYNTKAIYSLKKIQSISGNHHFKNSVAILLDFRESLAQELNLPRNHVIRDTIILKLAKILPKNTSELENLKIFSSKIKDASSYYSRILEICAKQRMLNEQKPIVSANTKIDEYTINIITLLKILLKIKCTELGVPSKLIATTKDLEIIATHKKPDIAALKGWRQEVFGFDALRLKEREIALSVGKNSIEIVEIK